MATKVSLRQKKISKGRKSLYLDFYPPIPHPETGKDTRREFLGFYIFEKPKTPIDKQHNTETLKIGESIRQKRENFLNKPELYSQLHQKHFKKTYAGKPTKKYLWIMEQIKKTEDISYSDIESIM